MASEADIIDGALARLGERSTSGLDDESIRARRMRKRYAIVRDRELSKLDWWFALDRVRLGAENPPPAFGWAHRFRLPLDFLRFDAFFEEGERGCQVTHREREFELEGRWLLTDRPPPCLLRYVARVEEAGRFDPQFARLLEVSLAYDLAFQATGLESLAANLAQQYDAQWRIAADHNANARPMREAVARDRSENHLLAARYRGVDDFVFSDSDHRW